MAFSLRSTLRPQLLGLPRGIKRVLVGAADAVVAVLSLGLALTLKTDSFSVVTHVPGALYLIAAISAVASLAVVGLYHALIRFISLPSLAAIVLGGMLSALVVWISGSILAPETAYKSVSGIYFLAVVAGISGLRIAARWAVSPSHSMMVPVIIYGAGEAGAQLAAGLRQAGVMSPVAFVDEKISLQGTTISGVRVRAPNALRRLVSRFGVQHVLLALPAVSRGRRAEIISGLVDLGVNVQTVPDLREILSGAAHVDDLREVSVDDLLGRDAVAPKPELLDHCIREKSVMVTGAGGSIGSELCRQILAQRPRRLVLFELSEASLYQIDRELRAVAAAQAHNIEIVGLLGNTRHRERLAEVMRAYAVQTVYHAAAYKHVPIVEQNVVEGIHNNVFATWASAEAAIQARVEHFVLISTDKAVHPTNVMGATKRYAEIVLQALQRRQVGTKLCMVRFGNVLGSSGSVVPLFKEQIRDGGPITVTHPEVRRYFMTIPEAASLVLQAGSMARGGEVFVLDMGQPVLIADLARRMIALAGRTVRDDRNVSGEIEICYTGLRPGEKLYEELLIGNNVSGTDHPMILRAMEHAPTWEVVHEQLQAMEAALTRTDCEQCRNLLAEAVAEYRPADLLHDLVWSSRTTGNVTRLADRR